MNFNSNKITIGGFYAVWRNKSIFWWKSLYSNSSYGKENQKRPKRPEELITVKEMECSSNEGEPSVSNIENQQIFENTNKESLIENIEINDENEVKVVKNKEKTLKNIKIMTKKQLFDDLYMK